jgi:CDP-glycerol glycerophosphotransferase (TagB/SpsB family)
MRVRRLAGAARRRLRPRPPGAGRRVSVVVGLAGPETLDAVAALLTGDHRPVELCAVCEPGPALPSRVGRADLLRAATVDEAVRAATGDLLVFADPGDLVAADAWSAMAAVLEESGSDLVVGDCRAPTPRGWAGQLFGRRRLRENAASCPLALVDLSLTNKMFRLDFWRRADIRVGPGVLAERAGGVAESGSAAVMAAYLAAEAFDVLPQVVCETPARERSLPVGEQARFRPEVLAVRLERLAEVVDIAPPGWCDRVAAHLLPALYVDAVGGGEAYLAVLRAGIGPILDRSDPARVPVPARLGAWVARHGTLEDDALVQDMLADHPDGLPVSAGLVPVPAGLSVHVPDAQRAVTDVDRRARCWVADRLVLDGTRCALRGAGFVEYVDEVPLPAVRLVVPGADPVPLHVERRVDPRTNEWAARAWEDRADAGWTAWFDAALLTGSTPRRCEVEVEVEVEMPGAGFRFRVQAPAASRAGPSTEVDTVSLAAGVLSLAGRTAARRLSADVSGPRGSTRGAVLEVAGGRFTGAVELSTPAFGRQVRLPVGRYRLRLTSGDAAATPARWSTVLTADDPELVDDRQRVTPVDGGSVPALRVRAPLRAHERGAYAQQTLRSRVYAAPSTPSYDRTVLLETFRGRSVGDNPGAIGRELLARDLGLDLVWVVDDPSAPVPDGTRMVARRSEAWYDVLANAHVYVGNAGAPYWFEKKPGQVHLQTWHGTPLKRIGEDRGPGDFGTWRHRRRINAQAARWDAMLSPSPYCSGIFRSAFRYGGTFWEIGYPRNDVLLSPEAGGIGERVRRELGVAAGDRVVLYAPTWRSYLGERDSKPLFLDAALLSESCPDVVVLLRGHYTGTDDPEAFVGHPRIHDVTRHPDVAELYLAADVLVTDYSSVMFDFVLTDKPIVLLTPDLEQYREVERGFYVDLEDEAPGPLTRSTRGVVEALSEPDRDAGRRARFRARFCPLEDGRSAEQAVDRLLDLW